VRDPEQRQKLGAIYPKASDIAEAMYAARGRPPHLTERQFARLMATGSHLWRHMGEAPVLLLPCGRRPVLPPREALAPDIAACWECEVAYVERIRGASPAVQNIILACRALGLGTVITTNQGEVKALLAARQIRPFDPPAVRRGRPRRPLGNRLAWLIARHPPTALNRKLNLAVFALPHGILYAMNITGT
jgi:nitroreductase